MPIPGSEEGSVPQLPEMPGLVGWVLTACVSIGILLVTTLRLMYTKIEAMYVTQLTEQAKQIGKVEERCKIMEGHYQECVDDREQLRVVGAETRARLELLERDLGMRK
jgi:hypothetical protein